ncbi:hypothetical protein ACWD4J_12030 [Streptomyces sp. NPDC002577]
MALAGLAALGLPQSPAAAASAPHDNWKVERVAGGFRVTLDLPKPLPATADAPTLTADGTSLGPATESADGMRLSLVTTDPSVVTAQSVTADAPGPQEATADGAVTQLPATPQTLAADPAAPGPYVVKEGIYAYGDEAVPLLNIGGTRGELEGKIYLPTGGGDHPVVVFLHGRHSSCYGSGRSNPAGWPCRTSPDSTEDRNPIPSYLGYDAPARALASNGYAVVSISANAINATDNQRAADYGAQARGQLVLDTLQLLKEADEGRSAVRHDAFTDRDVSLVDALAGHGLSSADLVGQFDLNNVGIMGHSRGGEGVVAAATLNDARPVREQFGIRAVLPLAPVDYDRFSLPNTVTATVLPYCDGDVENLMGQHIVDDSRHSFDDNVLRSAVLVQGANHNYFNTIWTPGGWPSGTSDDWSYAPATSDPVCDPEAADTTRLTPNEQVAVGTAYISGFFRMVLGGEQKFLPLFDGENVIAPSVASFATVTSAATQPERDRTDLASFEAADPVVSTVGGATSTICASMGGTGGVTLPQTLPFCSTGLNEAAVPHWSPAQWAWNIPSSSMLHLTWDTEGGGVSVAVPNKDRDLSHSVRLTFKTAADEHVAHSTDLAFTVVDGRGRTWSSPVSALNPAAVSRLPGTTSPWLSKVILQQVNVPVATLAEHVDVKNIREIRLTGATPAGGVYLSDLTAESPSTGARVPERQATVDVVPATVAEGDGPGTAQVAVTLSKPQNRPVTAYVSVFGAAVGTARDTVQAVTFAPGRTCVAVPVPTYGDTVAGASASTSFKVSATNPSHAVMGSHAFGTFTVVEDDGDAADVPGPQGDVCAAGE